MLITRCSSSHSSRRDHRAAPSLLVHDVAVTHRHNHHNRSRSSSRRRCRGWVRHSHAVSELGQAGRDEHAAIEVDRGVSSFLHVFLRTNRVSCVIVCVCVVVFVELAASGQDRGSRAASNCSISTCNRHASFIGYFVFVFAIECCCLKSSNHLWCHRTSLTLRSVCLLPSQHPDSPTTGRSFMSGVTAATTATVGAMTSARGGRTLLHTDSMAGDSKFVSHQLV